MWYNLNFLELSILSYVYVEFLPQHRPTLSRAYYNEGIDNELRSIILIYNWPVTALSIRIVDFH